MIGQSESVFPERLITHGIRCILRRKLGSSINKFIFVRTTSELQNGFFSF